MVAPDSQATACPPSGRNSTYRPVQICETSSIERIGVGLEAPSDRSDPAQVKQQSSRGTEVGALRRRPYQENPCMKKLSRRSTCSAHAPPSSALITRASAGTSSPCSGSKFSLFFPAPPHVSPC